MYYIYTGATNNTTSGKSLRDNFSTDSFDNLGLSASVMAPDVYLVDKHKSNLASSRYNGTYGPGTIPTLTLNTSVGPNTMALSTSTAENSSSGGNVMSYVYVYKKYIELLY